MTEKREIGNEGEAIARDYLLQQGYTIMDVNWQYGHLEIDIIAQKGNTLVFAEVKTRSSAAVLEPQMAVNQQKQRRIARAATLYLMRMEWLGKAVRFDVMEVHPDDMLYIPNAFQPGGMFYR